MGKKKSVVLMVLITVVLVVLTLFTACPKFWFPWNDGLKGWNAVTTEFIDFGSDYEGGYYAYYYPEGVISEAQYKNDLEAAEKALEAAEKEAAGKETEAVKKARKALEEQRTGFIRHGSLYFDKSADFITEGNEISEDFKKEIKELYAVISERFSQKGYTEYSVSLVDNYAFRVEVPSSASNYDENTAGNVNPKQTLQMFALTGELTLKLDGVEVDELAVSGDDGKASNFIKSFAVNSQFAYRYIRVSLTSKGADLIERLNAAGSIPSQSTATSQDTSKGLWLFVGEMAMMPIFSENIASSTVLKCAYNEAEANDFLQSNVIVLNSALKHGGFSFSFRDVSSEIRTQSHPYGENGAAAMLITLASLTVAAIVVAILLCKKYGVVFAYMACTYLCLTGLAMAFIVPGIFEFTLGTALVYVLGLVLMLFFHVKNYATIKGFVGLGKTVNSSVAAGYKSTMMLTVDVYAVLALAALAMLVGIAGVSTLCWQTLICLAAGALCNLLWGRVINHLLLSASKDKYEYFGLVREDDDDE
ncbi:MAG: hypothetical protein IJF39_02075 [Clostridia bacterium]|nr:hypothetical protein [Clostridia bacterium]